MSWCSVVYLYSQILGVRYGQYWVGNGEFKEFTQIIFVVKNLSYFNDIQNVLVVGKTYKLLHKTIDKSCFSNNKISSDNETN